MSDETTAAGRVAYARTALAMFTLIRSGYADRPDGEVRELAAALSYDELVDTVAMMADFAGAALAGPEVPGPTGPLLVDAMTDSMRHVVVSGGTCQCHRCVDMPLGVPRV